MRDATDMLVCRRFMKYERHSIHFTIHRLAFVIIFTVCSTTICPYNINALTNTDCTSLRTCTQCTNSTAGCVWLFENQTCVTPDQSLPSGTSEKSCPNFKLTNEIYSDTPITIIIMKLSISKVEENLKGILNKSEIKCEIDNAPYNASAVENDQLLIICIYPIPVTSYDRDGDEEKRALNPLLIVYFTIVVNGVRWKFDDDRDHYVAVYPSGLIMHGKSCEASSTCTIGFWNVGPTQYYCKWCLDNVHCKTERQEGKCYVRDTVKSTRYTGGNASVVRVEDGDVAVERFSPPVGPVTGGTTVSVTIRNHKVLAEHRNVTVTVAGRQCQHPKTIDYQTINCTVANAPAAVWTDSGPVVVSYYRSPEQQVYVLSSVELFRFEMPQIAYVRGPTCGPLSGGTRLTVVGQFLNSAAEVRVTLGQRVMCDVRLRRDDLVECVTGPVEDGRSFTDLPVPVDVALDGVRYRYRPPFAFRFIDRDRSSADATQGLQGRFECVQDPRVYVVYNGKRAEYDANGFQWTFGGQIVNTTIADHDYALNAADPVFTSFQVDDGSDPVRVTIHGHNLNVMHRDDVTVRIPGSLEEDAADECVVQWIDPTRMTCQVVSSAADGRGNRSVADAKALVIAVGTNPNRTVNLRTPGGAAVADDHEWMLAGAFVTLLLVLSLLAKLALAWSSKKWHMYRVKPVPELVLEEFSDTRTLLQPIYHIS